MNPQPAFPSSLLANRTFLVTGGTRGIGVEVAAQLAEAGAAVILNGRSETRGMAALAHLQQRFAERHFSFFAADLIEHASCRQLFSQIDRAFSGIDGVVHCANAAVHGANGRFVDVEPTAFRPVLDTALLSLMNVMHEAVPRLIAGGGGSIVTFASDSGKVAAPRQTMVGASRAGIMMFTRSLALEVAREGIVVNCVSPSFVAGTETYDEVVAGAGAERAARAAARAGLGLPAASDVARLAVFLSSPWAAHLTGQVISVNGGVSAA